MMRLTSLVFSLSLLAGVWFVPWWLRVIGLSLVALSFTYFVLLLHCRENEIAQISALLPSSRRNQDRGTSLLNKIRSLVWEAQSLRKADKDERSRDKHLATSIQEIARSGVGKMSDLPDVLNEIFRSYAVFVSLEREGDGSKLFVTKDLQKREGVWKRILYELNVYEVTNDQGIIFDLHHFQIDDSELDGNRYLLWAAKSDPELSFHLSIAHLYQEAYPPLPREREHLAQILDDIYRAYREFLLVQDVSTKAEHEQQKQERYFAHISHDIRTPLNNIHSILDLFLIEGLTEETVRFLKIAKSNCQSLGEIVEELLEFSRYRDGSLQMNPEHVRLEDIIQSVIHEFQLAAELKGIAIRSQITCQGSVWADRKQLKRIVMNLLSNAIKYTSEGSVEIACKNRDEQVEVSVIDSGVGIPKSQMHTLFTPFSRLGEVEVEGIGLGLALTKILVESNGGNVEVNSQHGEGSNFTLKFPRYNEALAKGDTKTEPVRPISLSQKILVIDDDRDAGDSLSRVLKHRGFEVKSLSRLPVLREVVDTWEPDVILSDVQMPDGGIERVIKDVAPRSIPIFALTGLADQQSRDKLLKNGVKKVFSKPVEPDELVHGIIKNLESSSSQNLA